MYIGGDEVAVGTEARQIRIEKGRSPNQESYCSEADESGSAEEAVGFRESAVGFEEAGWCYYVIEVASDRDWLICLSPQSHRVAAYRSSGLWMQDSMAAVRRCSPLIFGVT
jgi:hypothetical protein